MQTHGPVDTPANNLLDTICKGRLVAPLSISSLTRVFVLWIPLIDWNSADLVDYGAINDRLLAPREETGTVFKTQKQVLCLCCGDSPRVYVADGKIDFWYVGVHNNLCNVRMR
jgi:hypothetical protein